MSFNAFDFIQEKLMQELKKVGFGEPETIESEDGCAKMMATDEVAYGLFYDEKRQLFELKSAILDGEGQPGDWKVLSTWLFDKENGEKADAESIANDYLEIIKGPKSVAVVQQKKKKTKSEERVVDPIFFINRMVNLFPDLKEELKNERIVYGQVRPSTFCREKVAPLCQEVALRYPKGEVTEKMCGIFSDMYEHGDLDVRSIVTISILNTMKEEAFVAIKPQLSEALELDTRYTRRLIGKNIKPERKKKEKKVAARLGE